MKRFAYWFFPVFLAVCAAGCGKDSAEEPQTSSASAEVVDLDALLRAGAGAIGRKDAAAAAEAAAQALKLRPESAEAVLLAGQAACLKGDYAKARAQFESVIREKSLPAALRAQAYAGRGTVEFMQQEVDLARITLLHALLLDEGNAAARYYLGRIYLDVYQFNEAAKEQFEQFVRCAEDASAAKKAANRFLSDIDEAIARAAAQRLGDTTRNSELAAKLLGEARSLEQQGAEREARKKYMAAREADPLCGPASLGYARMQKRLDRSSEGVGKALVAYRAALDQVPAGGKDWYKVIMEAAQLAYMTKERWATVVKIMDRVMAHRPKDMDALDMLIGANMKTGSAKLVNAWTDYRKEIKK